MQLSINLPRCQRSCRKLVKKLQRKRRRQKLAKTLYEEELKRNIVQDNHEVVNDNLQAHTEAELQWLEREKLAQEEFAEKQKIKEENRRKHFENLAKKRAEKAKLVEEWQSQLFRIEAEFDKLLENDDDIPVDGFDDFETRPGKKDCEFYKRTGCCRFHDNCSRNHKKPVINSILLFHNLFRHYALNKVSENEHGSDHSLEFDEKELYQNYCEFFDDIYLEFSKCATIIQLKVCRNQSKHLCGNLYVEFEDRKQALLIYRKFRNRFYAGLQINVEFVRLTSWKSAICGKYLRKQCPRPTSCNYLHVFRNPYNLFNRYDSTVVNLHQSRHWRWSESP